MCHRLSSRLIRHRLLRLLDPATTDKCSLIGVLYEGETHETYRPTGHRSRPGPTRPAL